MAKGPKQRFSLSEKQLGYAMVLPSLILIVVVILWPIALSFWNSLFDYQLNDPTKAQKMISEQIDLENYADNYYNLPDSLKSLAAVLPKTEDQQKVNKIENDIESYHQKLMKNSEIKDKYKKVNDLLASFKPVTDSNLKYVKVDKNMAKAYKDALTNARHELASVQIAKKDQSKLDDADGLLKMTANSILEPNFIGFKNYGHYIKDLRMWKSIWNTGVFTVISVLFEFLLGLMVALIINRAFFGRGFIRAAVLIPWAIPTAVSAMMWKFLYDGQSGIISHYFEKFHFIKSAGELLTTPHGAMFSVIFTDVWKTTPYMALLLLAGLQTIPKSLYEAAQVDGANRIHQFFKITLPLLKPAILVALLFRTLDAFRVFDLIYVLTGGGPANSTETITLYAYKVLFSQQNFGAGSVLSIIVFLSVALISVIYIKFIGSDLFGGRVKNK